MTIEDQIAALLDQAAPLRALPEDEESELGAIVDRINALRALQAAAGAAMGNAIDAKQHAELAEVIASVTPEKRGPGRPRKAD